jgi:hypothetical protein
MAFTSTDLLCDSDRHCSRVDTTAMFYLQSSSASSVADALSRRVSEVAEGGAFGDMRSASLTSASRPATPGDANGAGGSAAAAAAGGGAEPAAAAGAPGGAAEPPAGGSGGGPSGSAVAGDGGPEASVELTERIGNMRTAQLASLAERADLRYVRAQSPAQQVFVMSMYKLCLPILRNKREM